MLTVELYELLGTDAADDSRKKPCRGSNGALGEGVRGHILLEPGGNKADEQQQQRQSHDAACQIGGTFGESSCPFVSGGEFFALNDLEQVSLFVLGILGAPEEFIQSTRHEKVVAVTLLKFQFALDAFDGYLA